MTGTKANKSRNGLRILKRIQSRIFHLYQQLLRSPILHPKNVERQSAVQYILKEIKKIII